MTISPEYAIIKIMKRDFWNGIRPLGHKTLLALSEDLIMITIFVIGFISLYILGTRGVTIGRPL